MARRRRSREGTFDRPFERAAKWLLARGIRPNHFTFLQIPLFAAMIWYGALGERPWTFVLLSLGVIVLDGGDGILARVGGMQSRAGAILDAVMDSIGIAVVFWGASRFYPEATWILAGLFVVNILLFVQNGILGEKVVSYVRGPVLAPIVFPDTLVFALTLGAVLSLFLLGTRIPRTVRALVPRRAAGSG